MSNTGAVKSFNSEKGFGFVIGPDGNDVFLHIKNCADGGVPQKGDTVSFDIEPSTSKPGQMQATNITGGTGVDGGKGGGKGGVKGTGAYHAQCKSFSVKSGFGFILGEDGADVFLHIKQVVDGSTPKEGDTLQFDIEPSPTKPGQMQAVNVTGGTGWGGGAYGKAGGKDGFKGGGWGGGMKGGGKCGPYGGWGMDMMKGWGKDPWGCGGKGMKGGKDPWGGGGKGWGGGWGKGW